MTEIVIKRGTYAKTQIRNKKFRMALTPREGKKGLYVTVDGGPLGYPERKVRVMLQSKSDVRLADGQELPEPIVADEQPVLADAALVEPETPEETDEQIMARMRKKFQVLDGMALATIQQSVRAMIVAGPPGVGKSFGIEKIIESVDVMIKMGAIDEKSVVLGAKRAMEKVAFASPLGLYQLLYQYSEPGSLLVLDDSDSILFDDVCLNMLKAVTDSGKTRRLTWRTESRVLAEAGIPDEFEFHGAIIFITNLNFENTRGKTGDHLKAIMSRCHYLDIGINSVREKFLRCKQIVRDGMLDHHKFTDDQREAILDYIDENKSRLRELSLRCVVKIAELVKMDPEGWRDYANETCIRNR